MANWLSSPLLQANWPVLKTHKQPFEACCFHTQGEVCFPEPSKGLQANKKKPLRKLPAWFGGCQPLAEPKGAVGLRTAAGVVLAGAGLTSMLSWLFTGGGWAVSGESLFRNEGRGNKCLLLEQENL